MGAHSGGAKPARTIARIKGEVAEYGDGKYPASRPLVTVPRQDLRALLPRMGRSGAGSRKNHEMLADVREIVAAMGGTWEGVAPVTNAPVVEMHDDEPARDTASVKLTCPNGHDTVVAAGMAEKYQERGCWLCGAKYGPTDSEPRPPESWREPVTSHVTTFHPYVVERVAAIRAEQHAHSQFDRIVSAVYSGENVYLCGPPGTGKSHVAQQVAEALERPFFPFSCDPAMTRLTLFGYRDGNGAYHGTPVRDAVEQGGVLLLDEMDNGNAPLLAGLNSLMANGVCDFAGDTVRKAPGFVVIGTANTWGTGPTAQFVGRLGLDPATLDRFGVRFYIDLDAELELKLATSIHPEHGPAVVNAVRAVRTRATHIQGLLISPRATYAAAHLMAAGWTMRDALESGTLASLDQQQRDTLLEGVC